MGSALKKKASRLWPHVVIIWVLGALIISLHTMGEVIKKLIVKVALAIKKM